MGSMVVVCIFLNVDQDFHTGSLKKTIFKYSFGREGITHKKSTLCTLLMMLAILNSPLKAMPHDNDLNKDIRCNVDEGIK